MAPRPSAAPPVRPRHRHRAALALAAALVLAATSAGACSDGDGGTGPGGTVPDPPAPAPSHRRDPLPAVTPTPRAMRWLGDDVAVPAEVAVEAAPGADRPAVAAVVAALRAAGAATVDVVAPAGTGRGSRSPEGGAGGGGSAPPLVVRLGSTTDAELTDQLAAVDLAPPADLPAEGYVLAAHRLDDGTARVLAAGADAAGQFYAAQTLRQLVRPGAIAAVGVVDHPAMAHRGTIEGFYGSPWTAEERLDQMAFHGRYKLNTYVYAPKDDPYHRDRWREPYPATTLAGLRRLVDAAAANHVRFTFAVSPGVSMCYSDPADLTALMAKLDAVHAIGVQAFTVALDDIDPSRWSCPADEEAYGPASPGSMGRAHVDLVDAVQGRLQAAHPDALPLQVVPTDYRGTGDGPYRVALRERLAPGVEVMWTGAYVVPDEIRVDQARAAAATYGRRPLLWDNTPVNDFPATEGRLILAPYDRRERGLSAQLTGIVLNPMNQAAASKVQLLGAADFAWNDGAYDPARARRAAAGDLAGGDPATVDALLAFFDLENLAPTSATSGMVSQPQAPALAAALDAFRARWEAGDRSGAVAGLRPTAERIAAAPDLIRRGVADAGFVADCEPWLAATALWGRALVRTLDALDARGSGDDDGADRALAEADGLAGRARAVHTIPGETRPQGPVRVGDGVLDAFLARARTLR
ncbi:MAG TPA: beta-N-acetylglucosaminidase domain-containing protein [Acidimicrobiales bacterium]|nr:beta-N-acetylglucosaminidase domain-containing protein [Acidimicrobiales bacterium]